MYVPRQCDTHICLCLYLNLFLSYWGWWGGSKSCKLLYRPQERCATAAEHVGGRISRHVRWDSRRSCRWGGSVLGRMIVRTAIACSVSNFVRFFPVLSFKWLLQRRLTWCLSGRGLGQDLQNSVGSAFVVNFFSVAQLHSIAEPQGFAASKRRLFHPVHDGTAARSRDVPWHRMS